MSWRQTVLVPLVGPAIVIVGWWVAADVFEINLPLVPRVSDTLSGLRSLTYSGSMSSNFGATASRWLAGYLLGASVGSFAGLLIGSSRAVQASTNLLIDFFRSLPVTAMFPLFMLAFGIGNNSNVALIAAATLFPVLIASSYGVKYASGQRVRMAESFGATKWQVFWRIRLFEALPHVAVGWRQTLSLALIVGTLAEMFIGSEFGVGTRIFDSYSRNNTATLYAWLLALGLFGWATNRVFFTIERRVIFWGAR